MVEAELPEVYILNLAGTDRFSWRLRSDPCMDADEIAQLHHGDKINAVRDVAYPGWLKLVDTPGWVKEAHEEQLVWKTAQSQPSAQVTGFEPTSRGCKDSKLTEEHVPNCSAKLHAQDISSISPSSASSNGHNMTSTGQVHALSSALPRFFTGKSCRIGVGDYSHVVVTGDAAPSRWFTGQSCKIAPVPSEKSTLVAKKDALRPRWADMEDTDEEDINSTPRLCQTEHPFDFKHLDVQLPGFDLHSEGIVQNTPEVDAQDTVGDEHSLEHLGDKHRDVQLVRDSSINERVILKPKRHKRNRELLQRKSKTQMCQYMAKEGSCPFGDSCWFAHSTRDLKDQ